MQAQKNNLADISVEVTTPTTSGLSTQLKCYTCLTLQGAHASSLKCVELARKLASRTLPSSPTFRSRKLLRASNPASWSSCQPNQHRARANPSSQATPRRRHPRERAAERRLECSKN